MTAAVIGELTADSRHIVLMADGPTEEQGVAARYLTTLTPLMDTLCGCGHLAKAHNQGACRACPCRTEQGAALQCPATWAVVVQLAATFGQWWKPGPRLTEWTYRELAARTAAGERLAVAPPAGLEPRPYQVTGARMIGMVGSALLFDEMGTGKTVSTILGLRERIAAVGPNAVLPVVVVCPSAVVDSWLEHVERWAPELRARPWSGTPGRRRRRIGTADVYVATYGVAARDAKSIDVREVAKGNQPLVEIGARTVIADEVHKIKDSGSGFSRAVRNLATRAAGYGGSFVGLSGTPITHSPKDLWPALYCVSPGAFPSGERWAYRYCDTAPSDYGGPQVLGLNARAEPEFRNTLLGQYRRVAKADVLAHLPPKVYSVRQVELPDRFRKVYDEVENSMLAELEDGGGEFSPENVLTQMGGLLALASAAADVRTWYEDVKDPATGIVLQKRHQEINLKAPSWKVDELLDILDERGGPRSGHQAAVYAPSRQLIMLASAAARTAGYRVGHFVGTGRDGVTTATRKRDVAAFQAGELDLMCVTTEAGGVGLTLTAAATAVFLQRPWSLVASQQAEDRQHRIGSERHADGVEIIDVVAKNTLEARVRALLKDKAQQLSDLVQDPRIVAELLGGSGVRDLRKKAAA